MKSEYFPSLSLFWHRTRFEHLVYLIYTFTGSRSKELLGTLDREFINKYLLKICEYELFFFSYIQNVCTIFRCFPSQGSRKVRCEEWEEAWVALTLSGGEPCVCLVISNVWVPLGGPLCSEPGLGLVDNSVWTLWKLVYKKGYTVISEIIWRKKMAVGSVSRWFCVLWVDALNPRGLEILITELLTAELKSYSCPVT